VRQRVVWNFDFFEPVKRAIDFPQPIYRPFHGLAGFETLLTQRCATLHTGLYAVTRFAGSFLPSFLAD
jgi:hypothetical protein